MQVERGFSGSSRSVIWPGGDSFVILQPHFISHLFMRGTVRKISLLMTVVFAIFVCGNTLFIHTHSENGQTVTHSHPYLPGQAHHHSANAFQCIGGANAATFSMLPSAVMSCGDFVPRFMGQIALLSEKSSGVFENESLTTRGPPAARV